MGGGGVVAVAAEGLVIGDMVEDLAEEGVFCSGIGGGVIGCKGGFDRRDQGGAGIGAGGGEGGDLIVQGGAA